MTWSVYYFISSVVMKEQLAMLIQQVPYGRVISYGALAERLNILTDATTS